MKFVETDSYNVSLYVGFKNIMTNEELTIDLAKSICQEYCNKVGLCVSVTPTTFIYTRGNENGCIIGFINYPRFPQTNDQIFNHAVNVAKLLKEKYHQKKVTLVASDKTLMISEDEIL
jgi:hypothetical protein